ncbi:MAG: hypothetical protein ACM3ML_38855 [Micromonosporaceae bacterium]
MREPAVWAGLVAGIGWLPVASLVLAADGSAVAVNDAWLILSRLGRDSWRGEGWLRAVEPVDRSAVRARLRLAAASGEPGSADCLLASPRGQRDCLLAGLGGQRRSRWWWRPGPAGELVVCVAGLDRGGAREPGGWPAPADAGRAAGAAAHTGIGGELATALIGRIFGAALIMESVAGLGGDLAAARLRRAAGELDAVIRDIRRAALQQQTGHGPPRGGIT